MSPRKTVLVATAILLSVFTSRADNVSIVDVPDYTWYAGCFGTASGNLMGYWDRNGFPNFYTGPTSGGLAPLDSNGDHVGIRSLWASKAGFDGRPENQPGHIDDYWEYFLNEFLYSYESTATDPYVLAGRAEHAPDCVGDFIGASQNKWADLDGECSGNIDAFSFNFWDKSGARRQNFTPPGVGMRDIQSGWRLWAQSRGYGADIFSQLVEFNPEIPVGAGFSFENLKAEINAGYPVMLFLQNPGEFSRALPGMERGNPVVHGMIAYGYVENDSIRAVRYRTSWGSGDQSFAPWGSQPWEAGLTLRGVIGFHPEPKITSVTQVSEGLRIQWDGPSSALRDNDTGETTALHWYVVERSDSLTSPSFNAVTDPSTDREALIQNCCAGHPQGYYRIKLLPLPAQPGA